MKVPHAILRCLPVILLAGGYAVAAGPVSFKMPAFHAATPAGYEVMQLKPSGATLSIVGLIECPQIEGVQPVSEGAKSRVISPEGFTLRQFPSRFSFRVTASLRKMVLDGPTDTLNIGVDPHELLLKLRFRLRVYDGLNVKEVEPESVEMIGVPADVPYDERVYRVSFDLGKVPVTDRCVLEVDSPDGKYLTHFYFGLL